MHFNTEEHIVTILVQSDLWQISHAGYKIFYTQTFDNAPTSIAFKSIAKVYRYLAGDPHILLHLDMKQNQLSQIRQQTSIIWSLLDAFSTYYCMVICVLGLIIQMKVSKSSTVMTHTTDAEMTANFQGFRFLIPVRTLFQELGCQLYKPSL